MAFRNKFVFFKKVVLLGDALISVNEKKVCDHKFF